MGSISSFDWQLLGMRNGPDLVELRRMAERLDRREGLHPKQVAMRWREALQGAASDGARPDEINAIKDLQPRILKRVMFRGSPGLALVSFDDDQSILILAGSDFSLALVISCDFDVRDICGTANEFLFILQERGSAVHELELTEQSLALAEEQGFTLDLEHQAYSVLASSLRRRIIQMILPHNSTPSRLLVVGASKVETKEEARLQQLRVLLWHDGPSSLLIANLPARTRVNTAPMPHAPSGLRQDTVKSEIVKASCIPMDTGLPASVLSSMQIGDIACHEPKAFVWASDSAGNRIVEIGLPGSKLRSRVILDARALSPGSKSGDARISSLIAYLPPADLLDSVARTQTCVEESRSPRTRLSKEEKDSMLKSLSARQLIILTERTGPNVLVVARADADDLSNVSFNVQHFAGLLSLGVSDLRVTQGSGDTLLIWSPESNSFICIDSQYSARASAYNTIVAQQRVREYKKHKQIPDT